MAGRLRLDIGKPVHGWAAVRLTIPGAQLEFTASYTPLDSIDDLARAACDLAAGMPVSVVIWNLEPVEYEFRFVAARGRTRLEVYKFPDWRRQGPYNPMPLAAAEEETHVVCLALWRGLRRLQGAMPEEEFEAAWRHPFPVNTVERLGNQLRGQPA